MTRCVRLQVAAFALSAIALVGRVAAADATADQLRSPVGVWKTIDDKTGKDRALVRIYEQDQKFFARIEHVLTPGDEARICNKCRDERRDQPVLGLVFMRGMSRQDDEYRGGDILDPETGSVYRCKFQLADDGRTLNVRGFIGFSLFGRSQRWLRQ